MYSQGGPISAMVHAWSAQLVKLNIKVTDKRGFQTVLLRDIPECNIRGCIPLGRAGTLEVIWENNVMQSRNINGDKGWKKRNEQQLYVS